MPSFYSSSTPTSRLDNISNHIMGSASSPWAFTADVVPQAAEDPLFGLMAAYRKDTSPDKVDLGIGAYRDNNAKPWVLPVVKKVAAALLHLNSFAHVLTSFYRQMRSCAKTQTSTMNICPSQAWWSLLLLLRSSSSVQAVWPSKRIGYVSRSLVSPTRTLVQAPNQV